MLPWHRVCRGYGYDNLAEIACGSVGCRSAFRQPIDKSMFNYKRFVGTRVIPEHRTAVISNRKGTLDFRYSVGDPDSYVFTADVYAYMENSHPDRHLGWSRFALPPGTGRGTLEMDFGKVDAESMHVTVKGSRCSSVDSWCNPDFAFDPLGDLQLAPSSWGEGRGAFV